MTRLQIEPNNCRLYKIIFNYALGWGDDGKNLSVIWNPIRSSGFHVEVALNNLIIGDCVTALQPTDALSKEIAVRYINEPINYNQVI